MKTGTFIEMNERMLRRRLKLRGIEDERANILLDTISQENQVNIITKLAGYAPGLHINNNVRVLVPEGAPIIPAKKGNWDIARELLQNMLGEKQLEYFFTWWKTASWRLIDHVWVPLQSIVLAGVPGGGKTTLLWLLGKSLGRKASPFDYITGKTAFNEDLANAELLAMDDEHSSALDRTSQDRLGDFLKWITVKPDHRVAPKGQKAHQLNLITTCAICTNLESQNLKIIPLPSESDMKHRQHVFKCGKAPMPMPVSTPKEKAAFYAKLESELPAIHHFLDEEWNAPPEIADPDGRFPCKAWQHPEIISLIIGGSRVMQFREIVLSVIAGEPARYHTRDSRNEWYSAADLKAKLERSDLKTTANHLARDVQTVGNLLAKWREFYPTEIRDRKKIQGIYKWRIVPPHGINSLVSDGKLTRVNLSAL